MSITTGVAPLTVSFTDTSSGDGLTHIWAFGDGGTSTQPNPTYTYDDPGNYEVTLLVENDNGDSQASQTVIVSAASSGGHNTGMMSPNGYMGMSMGMGDDFLL